MFSFVSSWSSDQRFCIPCGKRSCSVERLNACRLVVDWAWWTLQSGARLRPLRKRGLVSLGSVFRGSLRLARLLLVGGHFFGGFNHGRSDCFSHH